MKITKDIKFVSNGSIPDLSTVLQHKTAIFSKI